MVDMIALAHYIETIEESLLNTLILKRKKYFPFS